jgi:hypothetical protein
MIFMSQRNELREGWNIAPACNFQYKVAKDFERHPRRLLIGCLPMNNHRLTDKQKDFYAENGY